MYKPHNQFMTLSYDPATFLRQIPLSASFPGNKDQKNSSVISNPWLGNKNNKFLSLQNIHSFKNKNFKMLTEYS